LLTIHTLKGCVFIQQFFFPIVKKYLNKNDDEITDEDLKKLPDYFRTAHEIN